MSDPQGNPDGSARTVRSFRELCPILLEISVPSAEVSEELGLGSEIPVNADAVGT